MTSILRATATTRSVSQHARKAALAGSTAMRLLALCGILGAMGAASSASAQALPTGGMVSAGAATISAAGSTMTVHQATQNAAINWQTFNIGADQSVVFVQPNSAAVARPVLQRHRSMASCRASATAIFFFRDAPCFNFARYFTRACQLG